MKKPPIPTFVAHYPQPSSGKIVITLIVIALIVLTGAIIIFTNKKEDETA